MSLSLPLVVAESIKDLTQSTIRHYIPLRGSIEGSFGETHLIFTADGSLIASSKTSALGAMETLELDGQFLPELVSDRWGDALAVRGSDGAQYGIQLDSLGRDQALEGLASLYRQRQAWRHLAKVLEKQAAACYDDDTRNALSLELARLHRIEFGQPGVARDVYERILRHQPGHAAALSELMELFRSGFDLERTGRDLPGLLEAQERWDDLLFARGVLVECFEDRQERLHERMELAAHAWHRASDATTAIAAAGAALCEAPSLSSAWELLDTIPTDEDSDRLTSEMLSCLTALIDDEPERVQIEVLTRQGRLLSRLGRRDASEDTWRRVLKFGLPAAREAFDALYDISRGRGDSAGLVELIDLELALPLPVDRQLELWCDRGALAATLGDAASAQEAFRAALNLFGEHRPALEGLVDLYQRSGAATDLYDVTLKLSEIELEAAKRVELAKSMARLAGGPLQDANRAIADWYRVRSIAPDDEEMIVELPELLRKAGRLEELAGVFADRIGHGGRSAEERDRLRRQLARLYQNELEAADRAEHVWSAVLESVQGRDEEALSALADIRQADQDLTGAKGYLERLVEVLAGTRQHDVMRRLAVVCEELGDLTEALELWTQLHRHLPADLGVVEAIVRVAPLTGQWEPALSAQRQRVSAAAEGRQRGERLIELARMLEKSAPAATSTAHLIEAEGALVQAALATGIDQREVALTRLSVLEKLERWPEQVQVITRSILPTATDAAQRQRWLDEALTLYAGRLGTPQAAVGLAVEWIHDMAAAPDRCRRVSEFALKAGGAAFANLLNACNQLPTQSASEIVKELLATARSEASDKALVDIGNWYFDHGELAIAEDCFMAALSAGDRSGKALHGFVRTMLAAERGAQALLHLDKWIDTLARSDGAAWRTKLLIAAKDVCSETGDIGGLKRYESLLYTRRRVVLGTLVFGALLLGGLWFWWL